MTSHRSTILVALLTMTVALAGCTDNDDASAAAVDSEGDVDLSTIDLGNKGAITGLVVDDNYRPIQLKEDWGSQQPGDFQDIGFVLIMETAQRMDTTENGEFNVLPLEPGTYTIRIAADNHEAIDQTVTVVAGEFSEITVEARRTFSAGGTTLSQEYVMFVACSGNVGVLSVSSLFCGDLSGDGQRGSFESNYGAISDDIRGMVTEMRAQQEGYYGVAIRSHDLSCSSFNSINGCIFAEPEVNAGVYGKAIMYPFKQWQADGTHLEEGEEGYCTPKGYESGECSPSRVFATDFGLAFNTVLFPESATEVYTDPAYETVNSVIGPTAGVRLNTSAYGVTLGVRAQFLQTVFLYELPEVGIEEFCALCDDADIPE